MATEGSLFGDANLRQLHVKAFTPTQDCTVWLDPKRSEVRIVNLGEAHVLDR